MSEIISDTIGINQAAFLNDMSRQGVYVAIKNNKLKATKEGRWKINMQDFEEYRKNRWNRLFSKHAGKPLVSNDKGEFLVRQIAESLGIPEQKIYFAIYSHKLKCKRRGKAYIINMKDALEYKSKYLRAIA